MESVKKLYQGGPANPDNSKPLYLLFGGKTQTLYSPETLKKVDENCRKVAGYLDDHLPVQVRYFGTVKSQDESQAIVAATKDSGCIGLLAWFPTFSPGGLHMTAYEGLTKPYIHMVTSMDRTIPADEVDMDFMNGNQTPHGFREGGNALIKSRIRQNVVAGHYEFPRFIKKLEMFARAAAAYTQLRGSEILRIGGKMSGVRGTDCDPAELHRICGVRVNDDVSADDIYKIMKDVSRDDAARLVQQWATKYDIVPELKEGGARYEEALHNAKLSLSIDKLVNEGKYIGWTSYFGTLNPINTLPAMCAQESMARGMAYGAEGDVSAATVVAAQLIMGQGLKGASSFSEPYVFDWESESILHAHMAESNPELAGKNKVRAEIHKLDIGKSGEPVRLIFDFAEGDCTLTSLFSTPPIGYQLMTADGEIIPTPKLPKLPTARGLVRFKGGLETAIECQAYAGETHHPALSTALNRDYMATLARMWGIPHHAVKEGTNSEDFADRLELLRAIYR